MGPKGEIDNSEEKEGENEKRARGEKGKESVCVSCLWGRGAPRKERKEKAPTAKYTRFLKRNRETLQSTKAQFW